jgi:hypothetical protein
MRRSLHRYSPVMSPSVMRLLCCGDVQSGPREWRDAGLEVVLLDAGVSPEQLVAVAVQEDVGLIAVSDAELGALAVGSLDDDVVVFWITSALPTS